MLKTGKYTTITQEARECAAKAPQIGKRIAMAFVIKSIAHRLVGNFFIRFNKPVTPTKIFNDENSAKLWAIAQLKNNIARADSIKN